MSRTEFIRELEILLADVSKEEREEALRYYEDYFEDAGGMEEENVIKQLGTPQQVADIIKADCGKEGKGEFTERGYTPKADIDASYAIVTPEYITEEKNANATQQDSFANGQNNYGKSQQASYTASQKSQTDITSLVCVILACIFLFPVGFGFTVAACAILFSFFITFISLSFGMFAASVGCIIFGVGLLGTSVAGALVAFGMGLIFLSIGLLVGTLAIWICFQVLPSIIRWVVEVVKKTFTKTREGV